MEHIQYRMFFRSIALVILLAAPQQIVAADDERRGDTGLGYLMSDKGQSLFYSRGTDPFKTYHRFFITGIHIEEKGLGIPLYNPYTGRYERNAKQVFFIESGGGLRKLLFIEQLAGGFFPHVAAIIGASANIEGHGKFSNRYSGTRVLWAPYLQAGAGASIHTGGVIYRIELGYLKTISKIFSADFYHYKGMYLKIALASGQKPR